MSCDFVILAAGLGSRLRPITLEKPKCMLPIMNETLIQRQLTYVHAFAAMKVHIVLGHQADKVHLPNNSLRIKTYLNTQYQETNNMYSFYMTREELYGKPFFLLNGDVYIQDTIQVQHLMRQCMEQKHNIIFMDPYQYDEESMKIQHDAEGCIQVLNKTLTQEEAQGISLDFYFINADTSTKLFDMIEQHLKHTRTDWTEVALQQLMKQGVIFKPCSINADMIWKEIDTITDMLCLYDKIARKEVHQRLPRRFLIDLDGTVFRFGEVIPGAVEVINSWRQQTQVKFLTNNTSKTSEEYVSLLDTLGIQHLEPADIISPLQDVKDYLLQQSYKAYVFGNPSVKQYLEHTTMDPDIVVICNHTTYSYSELCDVIQLLHHKHMSYIATHSDMICPHNQGSIPDVGVLIHTTKTCTGKTPLRIFGKPFLRTAETTPAFQDTIVIGDSPFTDREVALQQGYRFILVLTGRVSTLYEALSWEHVDHIVSSLGALNSHT